MTQNKAHLFVPLVKALADGKTIQLKLGNKWEDMEGNISFDYTIDHYRIKSEIKKVECWAVVCLKTNLVKRVFNCPRQADGSYAHLYDNGEHTLVQLTGSYETA